MAFCFHIEATDKETKARGGAISTLHGVIPTPAFGPVGTTGCVKTLDPDALTSVGVDFILCNTYHLYLRPGRKVIEDAGGLHRFMRWERPILTDSGGYQVFSLAHLAKITDEGVRFQSHIDGSRHTFSPEMVVETQEALGADIIMPLDEPVAYPSTEAAAAVAARRTYDWAKKSKAARSRRESALFGIVQGGTFAEERKRAAESITSLELDGYAIGGLSVGEPKPIMREVLSGTVSCLPKDRPRYLMGVGMPEDILWAVADGIDLFDCIVPTRLGRAGTVFTASGRLNLSSSRYAGAREPIEEHCDCYTCRTFSRGYLRHLLHAGEISGMRLCTMHNVAFYVRMMQESREAIARGEFGAFKRAFLGRYMVGAGG